MQSTAAAVAAAAAAAAAAVAAAGSSQLVKGTAALQNHAGLVPLLLASARAVCRSHKTSLENTVRMNWTIFAELLVVFFVRCVRYREEQGCG